MPTFEYPVSVNWSGGRDGIGMISPERSGVEIGVSVPPEFQGPGLGTNPEELFASAIAGCYSITFGIIAANRKLPMTRLEMYAVGTVEQTGPSFVYKKVVLKPKIFITADSDDSAMRNTYEMAVKTDAYCIIGNAVRDRVEIVIEPDILREPGK